MEGRRFPAYGYRVCVRSVAMPLPENCPRRRRLVPDVGRHRTAKEASPATNEFSWGLLDYGQTAGMSLLVDALSVRLRICGFAGVQL
jgi:hypothetical protein